MKKQNKIQKTIFKYQMTKKEMLMVKGGSDDEGQALPPPE